MGWSQMISPSGVRRIRDQSPQGATGPLQGRRALNGGSVISEEYFQKRGLDFSFPKDQVPSKPAVLRGGGVLISVSIA